MKAKPLFSITLDKYRIIHLITEELYYLAQRRFEKESFTHNGEELSACRTDATFLGLEGIRSVTKHVYPMGEAPTVSRRSFGGLYLKRKAKQ